MRRVALNLCVACCKHPHTHPRKLHHMQVLDCEARLRSTLAHEMCHVAAWAVSREFKQHHGPAFWAWARRFEGRVPDIKVTTCHSYDVHAPFRWQCSNYRSPGSGGLACVLLAGDLWPVSLRRPSGRCAHPLHLRARCPLQLWQAVPPAQAQHRHRQARVQPVQRAPGVPRQVQVGGDTVCCAVCLLSTHVRICHRPAWPA